MLDWKMDWNVGMAGLYGIKKNKTTAHFSYLGI